MANTNGLPYQEVDAKAALEFFKGQSITVVNAKPAKKKGEDGIEREVMITREEPLSVRNVISAKQWPGERITVITVDGKRYEAKGVVVEAEKK